eukprot:1179753-Prorocentrum_minimum.AAC.1
MVTLSLSLAAVLPLDTSAYANNKHPYSTTTNMPTQQQQTCLLNNNKHVHICNIHIASRIFSKQYDAPRTNVCVDVNTRLGAYIQYSLTATCEDTLTQTTTD